MQIIVYICFRLKLINNQNLKIMTQKVVTINRNKLDASKVVFPIGKIKGRNVYELMENEPDKLKWFVNQPFFREKHADIYNIIINGSNDIKDSKEHNEIVQLFYDYDFLFKLYLYKKNCKSQLEFDEKQITNYLNFTKSEIKKIINKYKLLYKHYLYSIDYCGEISNINKKYENFIKNDKNLFKQSYLNITDTYEYLKNIKCHLDILKEKYYKEKDNLKAIPNIKVNHRRFERKLQVEYAMNDIVLIDYVFESELYVMRNSYNTLANYIHKDLYRDTNFEIKPLVGEDYPEVLRQCKRQKTNVLIIKDFICESTSLQVVREMFNPIEIILLEDITNIIL